MRGRKTDEEIENEIREAKQQIVIGGVYAHYKNPKNLYTVVGLAIQEATNELAVIYRAEYGKKLLFIRDVAVWLEKVDLDGKKVDRFTLIQTT